MKEREKMQLMYDVEYVQNLINENIELKKASKSDLYYLNQAAILDSQIKDLQDAVLERDLMLVEKDNQINELELALSRTEFEVAELTEEIEEKYNRINDLADTLDTIRSICEKGL